MNVEVDNPLIKEVSSYKLLVVYCYDFKIFRLRKETLYKSLHKRT